MVRGVVSGKQTQPPLQGQILKLDLDPALGHEQKGHRPVLVVSASLFNRRTGFSWVIPITTQQKGLPAEIRLPDDLPINGMLLLSQLRAIDWRARPFSVNCSVPANFLNDILARLNSVLEAEQ